MIKKYDIIQNLNFLKPYNIIFKSMKFLDNFLFETLNIFDDSKD